MVNIHNPQELQAYMIETMTSQINSEFVDDIIDLAQKYRLDPRELCSSLCALFASQVRVTTDTPREGVAVAESFWIFVEHLIENIDKVENNA